MDAERVHERGYSLLQLVSLQSLIQVKNQYIEQNGKKNKSREQKNSIEMRSPENVTCEKPQALIPCQMDFDLE